MRNRTKEARALCEFQHQKGEKLFCFLLSDPIIVGLEIEEKQKVEQEGSSLSLGRKDEKGL